MTTIVIKLRMEHGNISKRQQPDHRAKNGRRQKLGIQRNEKIQHSKTT